MKRLIKYPMIIFVISLFLFLCGCSNNHNQNTSNNPNYNRIILEKNDYDSIKSNWFSDDFINNKAKEKSIKNIIKGETYIFIYSFELVGIDNDRDSQKAIAGYLSFNLKTWGDIYYNNDGIDIKGYETSEQCLFEDDYGNLISIVSFDISSCEISITDKRSTNVIKDYLAVEFSPKYSGYLNIESLVYGDSYKQAEDKEQYLSATVFETKNIIDNASVYSVSNVSYGLVSEDVYNSNDFDQNTDLESISEMKIGKNYVIVDYDINVLEEKSLDSLINCGIYMHNGLISSAELEEVNTSKTKSNVKDDGYIYDFSYKCPTEKVKRIRTVLSFEVSDICLIDLELFFYSDNAIIEGINYSADYFQYQYISTLNFEFNNLTQILAVTGLSETKTSRVVIPMRYKGLRVLKVEKNAFDSNSGISTVTIGDYVEIIGFRAFHNCSNLEEVNMGKNVKQIQEMAFSDCTNIKNLVIPRATSHISYDAFSNIKLISRYVSPITFEDDYGWYANDKNIDFYYANNIETYLLSGKYFLAKYNQIYISNIKDEMSGNDFTKYENEYKLTKNKHYVFTLSFDVKLQAKNNLHPISEFIIDFTLKGKRDVKMSIEGATAKQINYYANEGTQCFAFVELDGMNQNDVAHLDVTVDFWVVDGSAGDNTLRFRNGSYTKVLKEFIDDEKIIRF